jgi:hypothetical protein
MCIFYLPKDLLIRIVYGFMREREKRREEDREREREKERVDHFQVSFVPLDNPILWSQPPQLC